MLKVVNNWTEAINQVVNMDCFNLFPLLPDKSIDMILCDLPYGTTACKWDTIIPFEPLWEQYKRIIKDNGAIVLTASQPFTSALVMSNIKMFKYEWVWEKSKATGYLNCKKRPMVAHENILIFGKGKLKYNPQKTAGRPYNKGKAHRPTGVYGKQIPVLVKNDVGARFPRTVQYFITAESEGKFHPTQKPVALFEYLIKTYTNEEDLVLDNCAGSFTTSVACNNLKRRWVCIEKEEEYCRVGENRLRQQNLF